MTRKTEVGLMILFVLLLIYGAVAYNNWQEEKERRIMIYNNQIKEAQKDAIDAMMPLLLAKAKSNLEEIIKAEIISIEISKKVYTFDYFESTFFDNIWYHWEHPAASKFKYKFWWDKENNVGIAIAKEIEDLNDDGDTEDGIALSTNEVRYDVNDGNITKSYTVNLPKASMKW